MNSLVHRRKISLWFVNNDLHTTSIKHSTQSVVKQVQGKTFLPFISFACSVFFPFWKNALQAKLMRGKKSCLWRIAFQKFCLQRMFSKKCLPAAHFVLTKKPCLSFYCSVFFVYWLISIENHSNSNTQGPQRHNL